MTEAELQSAVIDLARMCGWRVAHFRPARTETGWVTPVAGDGKGFPDLVLVRDRVLFVELKSATGRLSEDQVAWLQELAAAGADARVWRPGDWDEIEAALRRRRAELGELRGI